MWRSADRAGGAGWHAGSMAPKSVFGSTLLIVGAEPLLAERAVAERLDQARRESPDVEVNELAASDLGGGRFLEVINGSLFAARTAVVVKDLANLASEHTDAVLTTALNPAEDLCLILVHTGENKGRGLLDKLAGGKGRRDKLLGNKVERLNVTAVKTRDLPAFVTAEAQRHQVGIDVHAARALVEAVGDDLHSLVAAVDQLAGDWEGEQLTSEMIGKYFGGRAEVKGFAVADALLQGEPGRALESLRWALSTGTAPVLVTSAVASSLRALGKDLDVRATRMSDNEVASEVGVPPWKVRDLARESRQWGPAGVAAAIKAVARADADVKGAASSPDFALEKMLLAVDAARRLPR